MRRVAALIEFMQDLRPGRLLLVRDLLLRLRLRQDDLQPPEIPQESAMDGNKTSADLNAGYGCLDCALLRP